MTGERNKKYDYYCVVGVTLLMLVAAPEVALVVLLGGVTPIVINRMVYAANEYWR